MDESLTGGREPYGPAAAFDQFDAQPLFQGPDLLAERGLGDVHAGRGSPEVEFLREDEQQPELVDARLTCAAGPTTRTHTGKSIEMEPILSAI